MRLVQSLFCLLLLNVPWAFALDGIHLDLGRVETEFFTLSDLVADLRWHADDRIALSLQGNLHLEDSGSGLGSLLIECPMAAWREDRLRCPAGEMLLTSGDGSQSRIPMEFSMGTGTQRQWEVKTERFDLALAPLSGLLRLFSKAMPAQALTGGVFHGHVQLGGDGARLTGFRSQGVLTDVNLASENAAEHLDVDLDLAAKRQSEAWHLATTIELHKGGLYLVSPWEILGDRPGFYIEPGQEPVVVKLDAVLDREQGRFTISHLEYMHPGILQVALEAEGMITPHPDVEGFNLTVTAPILEQAYPIYIQPLLLRTSINDLEIVGSFAAGMDWRAGQIREAWLKIGDTHLADGRKRFGIYALRGDLRFGGSGSPVRSTLGWDGLSFYRLNLGAGDMVFESSGDQIEVAEWRDIPILDGTFHIEDFRVQNFGKPGFSLLLDGRLTPVSLQEFSQAMGWPLLIGTLAGEFNGLHYQNNALELNGDLHIQAFAGDITLRDLIITGLFSQYSVLQGDIDFERLDLEQLTQTFTFGKIEGSLGGSVSDLVLEDWRPVSFEAQFATVDDERPRRISRRALENLNQLGGGLSGTMSRGFLSVFPEYSYGQLGISCYLHGGICELGGIRDVEGGSFLLTRGGLIPPWVEVRAQGRSIGWDELIDGIKQISRGGFEIK